MEKQLEMVRHFSGMVAVVITLMLALCSAARPTSAHQQQSSNVLYLCSWSEYITDEMVAQFTRESGIKVFHSTYDSNEALYAKLKMHPSGSFDLVMPSTHFLSKMHHEGLLQKIDRSKLINFHHLDPLLLNKPFDPHNDYSVPYLWGITGIGINSDEVDASTIQFWGDLWDKKYRNSLLLIDDARELFHIALRKLGYSANTTELRQIQEAYQALRQLLPNVLLFNADFPAGPFIAGEINTGMLWNGAIQQGREAGVPLQFIWPKEGAIFWMDSLVIPSGALHIDNALQFINFVLRPDIAAKIAERTGYATPNKSAKSLLPGRLVNNPLTYPNAALMQQGEWQVDVGEAQQHYEHYFQRLKSGG